MILVNIQISYTKVELTIYAVNDIPQFIRYLKTISIKKRLNYPFLHDILKVFKL